MKKIPIFKIFCSTCLLAITASAISAVIIYDKKFPYYSKDEQQNYTSEVTWDGAYHLGVDDNPDFVTSPTQQSIAAALHDQFSLAFPNTNDFTVQITNEFNAICIASPYSKIYSGSTNITWDVEQKLNLPSSVLLSPFYTQTNTMYENEDVTEQMVFDKLVSEYSNSLNINQLLLTQRNDITGEFTVQPKADSTVYNAASQLNAQINVTQSAVLTYTKTIITSGTDSGVPTFKYRGNAVTATYTVVSTPAAPISFSNNKLVYASGVEYSGGLFVITGSYTTGGNTYTASWSIFCQPNLHKIYTLQGNGWISSGASVIYIQNPNKYDYPINSKLFVNFSLRFNTSETRTVSSTANSDYFTSQNSYCYTTNGLGFVSLEYRVTTAITSDAGNIAIASLGVAATGALVGFVYTIINSSGWNL